MNKADFLRRVREAAASGGQAPALPAAVSPSPPQEARALAERFAREHAAVLGHAYLVETAEEARALLAELLAGAKTFARSAHALLDEVGLGLLPLTPAPPEKAEVGVTGCEWAIAATGSVVLSSEWGRLAALLPYRHVVVLRASQIVPDLQDAYLRLDPAHLPGAWGFHTGPSKSADIEQTMALGVHGPGRTDVVVLLD